MSSRVGGGSYTRKRKEERKRKMGYVLEPLEIAGFVSGPWEFARKNPMQFFDTRLPLPPAPAPNPMAFNLARETSAKKETLG